MSTSHYIPAYPTVGEPGFTAPISEPKEDRLNNGRSLLLERIARVSGLDRNYPKII